jgi:hypothetical protein
MALRCDFAGNGKAWVKVIEISAVLCLKTLFIGKKMIMAEMKIM